MAPISACRGSLQHVGGPGAHASVAHGSGGPIGRHTSHGRRREVRSNVWVGVAAGGSEGVGAGEG